MADITMPTTAVPGAGAYAINGVANGTLAQGQVVYKNTSKKFALGNAAAAASSDIAGVALCSATANGQIRIQTKGRITGLTGLTVGTFYYLSDTVPGAICLAADLVSASQVVLVGFAVSATELELLIKNTGVAVP